MTIDNKIIKIVANLEKENKELEKKLKNAIVPKFKIGQKVYYIVEFSHYVSYDKVYHITIDSFKNKTLIEYDLESSEGFNENDLFATRQEAENKLEERLYENRTKD